MATYSLDLEQLPEGYSYVAVPVTRTELKELTDLSGTIASGTVEAALRVKAGLREEPWGLAKKLARLLETASV